MESHRVKTVNTDKRSRKRLKFASSREKSKYATADVYRSYKRKLGTTTSTTTQREEAVHHNTTKLRHDSNKRRKRTTATTTANSQQSSDGRTAVVRSSKKLKKDINVADTYDTIDNGEVVTNADDDHYLTSSSTFGDELDITFDRNGSEIFGLFHRKVWGLVRSLPEILHHADTIIDLLLSYMLSPSTQPGTPSSVITSKDDDDDDVDEKVEDSKPNSPSAPQNQEESYIINHATLDILHLLSVLARDLRHEIHPYIHTKILPRILYDMLNPPTPTSSTVATTETKTKTSVEEKQQQQKQQQVVPLDVTIVEAAFRTISYIFKYDSDSLVQGGDELEIMRKYYGPTLVNRRDIMRHLASETFAPLIRNMKSDTSKHRHLKRVLRALIMSTKSTTSSTIESTTPTLSSSSPVSFTRTQSDAIDGISKLLFQVIKGVRGKLHSKGIHTIKFLLDFLTLDKTLLGGASNKAGRDMIFMIISSVVDQICHHVDSPNFFMVLNEILIVLNKNVIAKFDISSQDDNNDEKKSKSGKKKEKKSTTTAFSAAAVIPLIDMMKLLAQAISTSNHSDSISHISNEANVNQILDMMKLLCNKDTIEKLLSDKKQHEDQEQTLLSLFCQIWISLQEVPKFATYLEEFVSNILSIDTGDIRKKEREKNKKTVNEFGCVQQRALLLSEGLLPYLPHDMATKSVATCLLSTAAKLADHDADATLRIVFSVATTRLQKSTAIEEDDEEVENDELFFPETGTNCCISEPEKDGLVKACLIDINFDDQLAKDHIKKLGLALRCAPFLALLRRAREDSKENMSYYKRTSKWLVRILNGIFGSNYKQDDSDDLSPIDVNIMKALALESLSRLALTSSGPFKDVATVEKTLKRTIPTAEKFLLSASASIWAVKSVAAFVEALQTFKIPFSENANQVFDAVTANLRSPSHFLRLHTLQILSSYPTKPFVTDHADLDLDGDLDEEPSSTPGHDPVRSGPTGPCDIMETLLQLESAPITLSNERQLLSLVSRVEVLGRTGKLPVAYAEAAVNHMMGMFHVKFSPLWAGSARALGALANGHEDSVWPTLEVQLAAVMERPPDRCMTVDNNVEEQRPELDHHQLCIMWETSSGMDKSLFHSDDSVDFEGKVSRFQATDGETVMESVWRVLEGEPQLLAKHSRVLVPVFLRFLRCQYYFFHSSDPDARELSLHEHVDDPLSHNRDDFDPYILQRRLSSFMAVFGALDGPQQMVKHEFLKSVFASFLSHHDTRIANMALSSLLKYKPPYAVPYADQIKDILKKNNIREALLRFAATLQSGDIESGHRRKLVPLMARILFGRISARVKTSKSSKDSPAARRAAILSFLSILCETEDDLFCFVYLMTRSFVPQSSALKPMELYDSRDRTKLVEDLEQTKPADLSLLPSAIYGGYLNLLGAVISHLGYRIVSFVPQYMSIIIALCDLAQVKDIQNEGQEDGVSTLDSDSVEEIDVTKFGPIRTLCFHRLSDIFTQFASSVDFAPYAGSLWAPMRRSVELLPEMVINSDSVPALLVLLRTMSSHPRLLDLLRQNEAAVVSVIKCIAETTTKTVMTAALSFVENLLTVGGNSTDESHGNGMGRDLVKKHITLLLEQLSLRLQHQRPDFRHPGSRKNSNAYSSNDMNQMTWKRELDILCQCSELMTDENLSDWADKKHVVETMFVLLIPFLKASHTSESDKLNVLGILKALVPCIGMDAAMSTFAALSQILAPTKARKGISSLSVRRSIASVIEVIASTMPHLGSVASTLSKMSALHKKRIDELDYDTVIPEMNALSEDGVGWLSLCDKDKPVVVAPIVSTCFHFIYDDDGVMARGAFVALKALVHAIAHKTADKNSNSQDSEGWMKVMESNVMPLTRSGLHSRNASTRRYFILLIAEVCKCFHGQSSPHFHGDLYSLVREDNPDLDFFLGITHVQLHRRARALQRLRKLLYEKSDQGISELTLQSLSNVLLPLAMHPVYESKTKAEETLALEAIASVGTLSKFLSWSKYSSILWTTLTQFERHAEQERYIIGMICSIIDGFHFDVTSQPKADEESDLPDDESGQGSAVWRALQNRIIPRIEGLLIKEKVDRNGTRIKKLRPTVVLALLKLFQKLPTRYFDCRLPGLLTVICDALKNRDSDAREIARNTLAKMVVSMDIKYLADVVRELAITLTEGYYLHVRSASVHSILLELSSVYKPLTPKSGAGWSTPAFDKCMPAIMELIQEDLFGEAQERRESRDTNVRYVKEAGGSKSVNSVEMLCRLITFKPSDATNVGAGKSSIHCILTPLLERLRLPDIDMTTIKKIKEVLGRAVIGLSHNPSVTEMELFPFIYASVQPFVGSKQISTALGEDEDSSSDDDSFTRLNVSGGATTKSSDKAQKSKQKMVVEWRPSTLKAPQTLKAAREYQAEEDRGRRRVEDGDSAPKLTGSYRHGHVQVSPTMDLDSPACVSAVVFGLNLLSACLRKMKLKDGSGYVSMMDPFLPLLTTCVCHCRDTDVALISLKCMVVLLRFDLPSLALCAKPLGSKTLELLTTLGASSHQNNDLTQACFKTLTYLINLDDDQPARTSGKQVSQKENGTNGEAALATGVAMPLDSGQMEILISLLKLSITESEQHNPAHGLIKAIVSRRYISPEFYDLMETMLKMSVRSQKASVRQQSSGIFIRYLLNYPMGEDRFEEHVKQMVLNFKYEFQEGRISAVNLASMTLEKLPAPLVEKHAQLFFLPLVLQTANDESKECREAATNCLSKLLHRCPMNQLQSFFEYSVRWCKNPGPIQKTSLRVFGIFVDSCGEFLKRGDVASSLLDTIYDLLQDGNAASEWEIPYLSLLCLEKLQGSFSNEVTKRIDLWSQIVDALIHPHPWVKLVACRLTSSSLLAIDTTAFNAGGGNGRSKGNFLMRKPGLLFQLAKNLCFQLNVKEEEQNEALSELGIKTLTWMLPVMHNNRHLCFEDNDDDDDRDDDEDDENRDQKPDPVKWLMSRLSSIAKNKGDKRRMAIFKCFAAFATHHIGIVAPYLELMLEPLHRANIEASNELDNPSVVAKQTAAISRGGRGGRDDGDDDDPASDYVTLTRDVLQLLEESCTSSSKFLRAYANVKTKAREKKEQRKLEAKTEAVRDPQAAAKHRQQKQLREKKRKKRRVEERRQQRGVNKGAKRRHMV